MYISKEEETGILDLSKTSKIKCEPVRQEMPHNYYEPNYAEMLALKQFWAVPPLQEQYSYVCRNDPRRYSSSTNASSNSAYTNNTKNNHQNKITIKDEQYMDRRRKNNLAAKKSRDAKRARETENNTKLVLLQAENQQLKQLLASCCCAGTGTPKAFLQNFIFTTWLKSPLHPRPLPLYVYLLFSKFFLPRIHYIRRPQSVLVNSRHNSRSSKEIYRTCNQNFLN